LRMRLNLNLINQMKEPILSLVNFALIDQIPIRFQSQSLV